MNSVHSNPLLLGAILHYINIFVSYMHDKYRRDVYSFSVYDYLQ